MGDLVNNLINRIRIKVAKSLKLDETKIKEIATSEGNFKKVGSTDSVESDEAKLQAMEQVENDWEKLNIAISIKSDEIKLQLIDKLEYEENKEKIAISRTLGRDGILAVEEIYESKKNAIARSLISDEAKLQAIEKLKDNMYKMEIAKSIKSDKAKLQAMEKFEDRRKWKEDKLIDREIFLIKMAKSVTSDSIKMKFIRDSKDFDKKESLLYIIDSLKRNWNKRKVLKYLDEPQRQYLVKRLELRGSSLLFEKVEEILQVEGYEGRLDDKRNVLSRMHQKNDIIEYQLYFGMLDKKYMEQLGEDKINLISCYSDVQEKILLLNDKQLGIFFKCLNQFMDSEDKNEWPVLVIGVLNHISEYNELITNIGDLEHLKPEDIEMISQIIQNPNWCGIKNIDEVRCYHDIVKEKCNEIMQNDDATIGQKRNAVVEKIFGHNLEYARSILIKFGEDNENIDEGEMKEYVRCLQKIEKVEDEGILKEIFNTCEFVKTNKISIERGLRNEYCKKYNEGLYIPKDEDLEKGETNIYNAGTDFKMIIHAVGAYGLVSNPNNYKDDWNRPSIATQQVCTSYIRNDMIGTAPIKNICYGFSHLKPDSLILSGAFDIYSGCGNSLVVTAENEIFYTPDNQINYTIEYNEMDFRRVQAGKRMEPDYIVVFKENGTNFNMEEAKKASKEWGDLPIVLVDKDACLQSERQKVDDMLTQYEQNPSSELGKQIAQKVRNNKVTNANFCEDMQDKIGQLCDKYLGKEEVMSPERKVSLGEMAENYGMIGAKERENETEKMKKIYMQIQELTSKEKKENGREKN